MLHTFVVYVENKPGVLSRVVSLFRRRAFNIDSLTVGRTEKPDVSRMTIVTEADEDQARRIVANIYKLVNVLLVDDITGQPSLVRDLTMVKVKATLETRSQILELATVFRGEGARYRRGIDHRRADRRRGKSRPVARIAEPVRVDRSGAHRHRSDAPRRFESACGRVEVRGPGRRGRRHRLLLRVVRRQTLVPPYKSRKTIAIRRASTMPLAGP